MREAILERGEDPANFPVLVSKPEIFPDLVWVWEGFATLSSSRQLAFSSPQPLQISEVLSYLGWRGITDEDEVEEFVYLVQYLDRVFMADSIAKTDSKSKRPPSKT